MKENDQMPFGTSPAHDPYWHGLMPPGPSLIKMLMQRQDDLIREIMKSSSAQMDMFDENGMTL